MADAMPVSSGAAGAERRAFARLLRQALSGPLAVVSQEGAELVLAAAGAAPRGHAAALVKLAVSRGLLQHVPEGLSATPQASAFLRRIMAAGGLDEGFPAQHRDEEKATILHEGALHTVRRNVSESPLSALSRLKEKSGAAFLPAEALHAGERLAADFERGGLQPRITASWEPRLATRTAGTAGAGQELGDAAMAARRRVSRAIEAMGPELSGVALDVCCFAKGLETVERERQWPARSAKLMLRAALLSLARHYAPPAPPRRRDRHWGADDFRPVLGS